jgi:hypothetical protein
MERDRSDFMAQGDLWGALNQTRAFAELCTGISMRIDPQSH